MYNNYTHINPYYFPPICQCRWHHDLMRNGQQPDELVNMYNRKAIELKDYGGQPLVFDIEDTTEDNMTFRTVLWTGKYLQLTVMSLNVGEDIGLEAHPHNDQFLRIEEGNGLVQMGNSKDNLTIERQVDDDDAIVVPAGTWHNITNIGRKPLKLYSIYAPPEHPFGTVHQTKADDED